MPSVKYIIELSDSDRRGLQDMISKGKSPAKAILRANILLASDRSNKKHMTVAEIAETYHTTPTTVQNVRTSYANNGLEATISRKKRETPPVPPKVTGDVEAHLFHPWYTDRNRKQKGVNWQFTADDARIKLKRLYLIINI